MSNLSSHWINEFKLKIKKRDQKDKNPEWNGRMILVKLGSIMKYIHEIYSYLIFLPTSINQEMAIVKGTS